ncbi:tetratricopeptide repeat protein [Lentibacter sp. XHP0401]|uniref:tetratricopeptide repeat protein n=1 Tax=Lentibacter sp. XHP0401 TaxID=2984334 RepID=UPI0021E8BC6C|nr:tetratricopeptide repeat protein [Lentibacter sp. XHP0401]MCV2891527.1 tetratricopeptide repeat protein [Lentibacter sp. XHP0401]
MSISRVHLKPAVTALVALLTLGQPGFADETAVSDMLTALKEAKGPEAAQIARDIEIRWSASGSASANLLLKRGEDALDAQEPQVALDHFTALTDHAPAFAEGWHGRARAFFAMGEYGLALEDLKQTLALNPQHFGAIYGLGAILEQIEKPEEAYDAYKILLNLYPAHEKALQAIARLEPSLNGTRL